MTTQLSSNNVCPRCSGYVAVMYEPTCVACGWSDYSSGASALERKHADTEGAALLEYFSISSFRVPAKTARKIYLDPREDLEEVADDFGVDPWAVQRIRMGILCEEHTCDLPRRSMPPTNVPMAIVV